MLFEHRKPVSAARLYKFLEKAAYKYKTGMNKLIYQPGLSIWELLDNDIISGLFRLNVFQSMKKNVSKYFKDPVLRQLMEFPVLFLGTMPANIRVLYSFA